MFSQGESPAAAHAWAGCWNLAKGCHPHIARQLPALATLPVFTAPTHPNLAALEFPLMPATHGHHVVRDAGYIAAATPPGGINPAEDEYPLAPLFVKDLTGRIIHTGLMPLPAQPGVPLFPAGCADVPAPLAEAAQLENAVFTTFRRLECAAPTAIPLAGQPELALQALYARPSTYTYKLRPDTFYADGWRLPQTTRVFARPMPQVQAEAAAENFMQRWKNRPAGQDYEAFYDDNNGATWFEELFAAGCTIIPTLEAYNGQYHVDETYVATGVEAGRVVPGLHEVAARQPSNLPAGTILQVETPGWVTATLIHPARVVVSDGSGYTAPQAPLPLLPNLALPHPRVSATWGAVWLPTHPAHFAEPALWDWDEHGHFIQQSGPLWDPVHYVYSSTAAIVRAVRKPLPENPSLFELPESLKNRFHPVIAQNWYDALNERTAQQRQEDATHPLFGSSLDQLPLMRTTATLGYHALPLPLEYELDPAHFPTRNPLHRVTPCPDNLKDRLAPQSIPQGGEEGFAKHHSVVTEGFRAALARAEAAEDGDSATLLGTQLPPPGGAVPAWLPDVAPGQLFINIKRLFAQRTYRQALHQAGSALGAPTLAASLYQFREAALAWRRLRYRLFTKYPATWQKACVEGLDLATVETFVPETAAEAHLAIRQARAKGLGVRSVPVAVAGGLPSPGTPAKLRRNSSTKAR